MVGVKTFRLAFRVRERLVVGGSGCETCASCVSSKWWVVVDVKLVTILLLSLSRPLSFRLCHLLFAVYVYALWWGRSGSGGTIACRFGVHVAEAAGLWIEPPSCGKHFRHRVNFNAPG